MINVYICQPKRRLFCNNGKKIITIGNKRMFFFPERLTEYGRFTSNKNKSFVLNIYLNGC